MIGLSKRFLVRDAQRKKMEIFGSLVWRVDIRAGSGGNKQERSLQACMEKGKWWSRGGDMHLLGLQAKV